MVIRLVKYISTLLLLSLIFSNAASAQDDGVVRVKSAYSMQETIARLKQDVAAKGIMFFSEVDQSALAAKAGISIRPSTLLTFGNPPLGTLDRKSTRLNSSHSRASRMPSSA